MKRVKTAWILLLLLAGCIPTLQAARPTITGHVEPDSIMIGDRFDVVIDVERDLVQVVEFPVYTPAPESGLELYQSHPVDTLRQEGRKLVLRKRYTLAAFEEGDFNMGVAQALYLDKNIVDTLSTADSLHLHVGTFQIDSTSQSIYDLKPQRTLPFKYAEIAGYVWWTLLGLALLAGAVLLAERLLKRYGKGLRDIFHAAPLQPPHVVAIHDLETLHNQKLWQSGRYKQYYSSLTDILRTYLAGRYGFGAMEMTSDEILQSVRQYELPQKSVMDLTTILREADLVKFAKATPEAAQNEDNYLKALYFVEETKPQEEPSEEENEEEAQQ